MHRLSRRLLLTVCAALALASPALASTAEAAEKLKVVASFTILADMVRSIGGERVDVTTLVGPDGDAHVYEPTPADARALATADLVVVNGLGFEGWMDRLVQASGYRGPITVASDGVAAMQAEEAHGHGHGHRHGQHDAEEEEHDPHAWQDLANGRIYAANIARALVDADPAHGDGYRSRAAAYDRELTALDQEIRTRLGAIPEKRRKVITSHDAFRYFGKAYGIEFLAPVGISTDSEPSAKQVAALVRQMKKQAIRALFVENISNPKLVEQLAREGRAVIGGTLYSDSLSGPGGPAPTYIEMFRHNAAEIAKAVTS